MPNPFPGMNPYLEHPDLWPQVHHLLISILLESLVPKLLPKYLVAIEKRIYQTNTENPLLVGIPDVAVQRSSNQTNPAASNVAVATRPSKPLSVSVPMPEEVREGYLEIRDLETSEFVTVIEILSPKNKRAGKGREVYEEKRYSVLGSSTHLVEIDLLRVGKPMPILARNIQGNYRILLSRGDRRPHADLYLFNLPDEIPSFPLPLRIGDVEPIVELQVLVNSVYERAGYDFRINYHNETVPKLSSSEAEWVDRLLRGQGVK